MLEKQLRDWLALPTTSQPLPHDLLPVFQFREKNAAKVDDSAPGGRLSYPQRLESTGNHVHRGPVEVAQSANLLHSHYGQTLDPVIMQTDAFYAISELFAFSAYFENQFLNLLGLIIDSERHPLLNKMQASLANLEATRNMLEGHIRKQEATIAAIQSRGGSIWPRATNPEHVKIVNDKVETVLGRERMIGGDLNPFLFVSLWKRRWSTLYSPNEHAGQGFYRAHGDWSAFANAKTKHLDKICARQCCHVMFTFRNVEDRPSASPHHSSDKERPRPTPLL